ncbi:hypothetical protein [Alistipes sp.]|uniref:hypothetical protein n=1 Tax=Alistipes sp. TaxID=1872444 RepID=UPI003AF1B2B2
MKKLLLLAASLCCLAACSSSAAADSAADTVKRFYAAINDEAYDKAADCLYFDGKSVEADRKMMVEILSTYLGPELKKLGGVKVEILSEQVGENGEATVEFNMRNGSGQSGKETAKCVKDAAGQWKMRPAF